MPKINMAPRAHGNPSGDYKIMKCAQCDHPIAVMMSYSSNDPVYCLECVKAMVASMGKPAPAAKKPWWKIW